MGRERRDRRWRRVYARLDVRKRKGRKTMLEKTGQVYKAKGGKENGGTRNAQRAGWVKSVDKTESIPLQTVWKLHLKAPFSTFPPWKASPPSRGLADPPCPAPAGVLEAGQCVPLPQLGLDTSLRLLAAIPDWEISCSQPVPRRSCVPETQRTSPLLLARITLEQKGSCKHFHSVDLCHTVTAWPQQLYKVFSRRNGRNPSTTLNKFINKFCVFIKEQKENGGSLSKNPFAFLLVFPFTRSICRYLGS